MKKLIALTLAMVFLGTGIASATDFSLSGSYYVRGSYKDNLGGTGTDVESYTDFDHELSVDATWQIDDTTKVFARFEMRDETWGKGNANWWAGEGATDTPNDDNIYVEQVYGQHTFGNGGTLAAGLMTGGVWATAFHDKGRDAYRLKWTQPLTFGTLIGVYEKLAEEGNSTVGEDEDDDAYVLALVTKIGEINVKPLVAYVVKDSETPAADVEVIQGMLALDGTFGNIGFEAEIDIDNLDFASGADYTVWGAYLNIWGNLDALKIGVLGAYGSYDDGVAFDFGDDFEAGGALLMGDDILFGSGTGGNSNEDLNAGSLIAIYADYAVSEVLSFGAYLGYATCNFDDNSKWDGADVYEISADVTYKITDNLTYKVAAGTAQLEYGDSTEDPDRAVEVYHKLSFSF
jgi:hypothetical protein